MGPARGALCFTCVGTEQLALLDLSDEAISFVNRHAPNTRVRVLSQMPITVKLLSAEGSLSSFGLVPCVLCQKGANAVDHWLSYCPVAYIAWCALWKGCAPPISWRHVPTKQVGVALCYFLFHLRRLVAEYGGLQPVIECVKVRSVSRHAIDLWQRTYQSLPATLLHLFSGTTNAS